MFRLGRASKTPIESRARTGAGDDDLQPYLHDATAAPDYRGADGSADHEAVGLTLGERFAPEHDPEKCEAVFPRDKREAFARRSCSNKELKRDDDPA